MPAEKPEKTCNPNSPVSQSDSFNPDEPETENDFLGTDSTDDLSFELSKKKLHKEVMEMSVMDDLFARIFFRNQLLLVQQILRILTHFPALVLTSLSIQFDLTQLVGSHSARLDLFAKGEDGTLYNLEFDNKISRMSLKRILYYFCSIVTYSLSAGHDYKEIPPVCIIAIVKGNIFGNKYPVNRIRLFNTTISKVLDQMLQWIIVDARDRQQTPVGSLMHDFNCTNANQMHYDFMAQRMRELKETQKGETEMSGYIEQILQENEKAAALKNSREIASRLLKLHSMSLQEISQLTDLNLQEVEALQKRLSA